MQDMKIQDIKWQDMKLQDKNSVRPTLHYYEVCISCLLLLFSWTQTVHYNAVLLV